MASGINILFIITDISNCEQMLIPLAITLLHESGDRDFAAHVNF